VALQSSKSVRCAVRLYRLSLICTSITLYTETWRLATFCSQRMGRSN